CSPTRLALISTHASQVQRPEGSRTPPFSRRDRPQLFLRGRADQNRRCSGVCAGSDRALLAVPVHACARTPRLQLFRRALRLRLDRGHFVPERTASASCGDALGLRLRERACGRLISFAGTPSLSAQKESAALKPAEITRVESYLRRLLGAQELKIRVQEG